MQVVSTSFRVETWQVRWHISDLLLGECDSSNQVSSANT